MKTVKTLKLIISSLLLSASMDGTALASDGNVQQAWVARYNGPGNDTDYASAIVVDGSGNVYVTGQSYTIDSWTDYATIKYNSAGQQEWVARYNGPANSEESDTSTGPSPAATP
jgi:Beta-propeller repeat